MLLQLLITQVNDALREVDGVIGAFISGLKDRGVFDCVNMLLVTDHGECVCVCVCVCV